MSTDTTLLSWISTEVDQALNLVRERIAKFSATPEDGSVLKQCPEHLHQVSGALRMVGLSGATKFCEVLESSFSHISNNREAVGAVDKAVVALKQFLDGLVHGEANVPLRLFPAYRDLATLQGKSDTSEKDLFYPELVAQTPQHPQAKELPKGELAAYLQAQRLRFQRGMLGWLRNQPGGLDEMRQALDALHQVAAQLPEPRGVWWTGVALLEALQAANATAADPAFAAPAKSLGNKVDFYMRDLAAGAHKGNEVLMRELLYTVATAKLDTPRLAEVRQLYRLESLFPKEVPVGATVDLDQIQPALSDARSRLEALKGVWLQYISGEPKSILRFRELLAAFRAKAGELGNPHLIKLLDAIALVGQKLPDPHPQQNQYMVIEMSSAFLMVEDIIQNFASPAPDLEQQIALLGGWLLDASKGKGPVQPPAGLHADLSREIGAMQLRAQVAKEIMTNLQHVEQVLDAFARDSGKRDTLDGLQPYLRQIHGALVVLGLERAAEVLAICETMIAVLATADHPQAAQDLDWIAEGLSSLGFYLEPCLRGAEPADQPLKLFFRRYEQRGSIPADRLPATQGEPIVPDVVLELEPATPAATADADKTIVLDKPIVPEAPPAAEASRPAVNQELLEIYLDEAGEVLGTINAALPECRAQPANRDALTTIRRAFHTLKGSGRMVGLMDLGEVAWEIEQVMNRWLEQQRPATPMLLQLIEKASAAFATWVEKLRAGSLTGEIQAADIVELARRLKSGEVTEPPLAAAPAEPDAVEIGAVRLSKHMFEIFIQEAIGHVALLQQECERWKANRGEETPHEFLRAAHTLASSSRTAGFEEIANLAGAVEHWVPFARLVTDPDDALPVQAAIEALKQMVDAVAQQQAPAHGADITQALQGLTERLQSAAPAEPPSQPSMAIDLDAIDLDLTKVEPKGVVPEKQTEEKQEEAKPVSTPATPPSGRELRKMHDDIDEQLLPIFIEEAQTLLPQIGSDIRDLKAAPSDVNIVQSLQRGLHTLKGSARMAGAIRLGELTHIMESLVESALEKNQWDADLFAELEEKMDRLSLDLERMQGKPEPAAPAPAGVVSPVLEEKISGETPEAKPQPRPAPRAEPPLPSPAAMLRVNADTLDHLINEAGEVSIARSRIEAELRAVKQSLGDLSESIARLRGQLREVEVQADSQMQSRKSELEEKKTEFDPLEFDRYTRLQELTRLMSESLHDITSIQQGLVKSLGETDAAVLAQARTSRDVQQELMRMRAVPFSNLNERLYRIVRQTARDLEKKAELEIEGSQVELDRGVLDKISAPLEHMLRNSLAHGLEAPAKRVAAGKPETGRISITLRQESNEIALVLSDDGAGIDTAKVYEKALEAGVVTAEQPLTEAEQMHLIFASGLSTADQVTELSGRGVGMDVVRNDITSIGGRVDIASTPGKGTIFTIYLPLTLAVTQAVMVRAGGSLLAISAAMVENVLRLKSDAMASLYERRTVEIGDRSYPLYYLQQLLGQAAATEIQPYNSVLLLRSGIQRIALHVDELVGNQEIVVKSIGPQLLRVPGVAGATVLPDGGIVLLMNPVQLAQQARLQLAKGAPSPAAAAAAPGAAPAVKGGIAPVVMVVDDSLTVRKITSRLLEREGYQVLTAKDGVDALQQLKDNLPAVMLVDIEMPRMDGFDLTKNVRADPRLAGIPIVIISSRTADKHRNQAAQLGVNAFLGKPYQEAELLNHIATFVGARRPDITLH
jgi:chemosensory pili system protein ChpA (sensor histidine kinase/response regulator)